jgi:hypothetical protein
LLCRAVWQQASIIHENVKKDFHLANQNKYLHETFFQTGFLRDFSFYAG